MSNIFKAYDIRGIYPDEINKEIAYKIGFATVKFLQTKNPGKKLNLVVGEDARLASPTLRGAIIDALTKAGANVYYIGFCTSPLFNFSVNKSKADGGIMVTSSHNPPQYGGLKIVGFDDIPISRGTGLEEIEKIVEGDTLIVSKVGTVEEVTFLPDYIDFIMRESGLNASKIQNIRVVIDASNGMASIVLKPLMDKIKLHYIPLYFNIDCRFPNHSSDISKEENLADLKKKVVEEGADFGVAFDGDADRIFFVDKKGNKIRSDHVLALLFEDSKGFWSKPKVVYDLRYSKEVREIFGTEAIRSKVGYINVRKAMVESGSDLGGELAGHFFFKKIGYEQSTALVFLKMLKILSQSNKSIAELIKPFQKYYNSGETNIEIRSEEQGVMILKKLKEKYKDSKIDELDGVTVEYQDWWFNLRLSNTEPIIRLVVEADTKELMEEKVKKLTEEIKYVPL